jgi:TolB protein
MRRNRSHIALVSAPLAVLLAVGCQPEARRSEPLAADPGAGPQAGAPPVPLSLFGDCPEHEPVPFESHLVTNLTRHTFTAEGLDFDPDVSDTDDLLVFASTRNSDHADLFIKRVEGTGLTQLTDDPADEIQPRFSPGGQRVAFSSNRGGSWDIWMIGRDGTGLAQLTSEPTDEVGPCWSPDGSQVAYTVWGHRSRQWEIWTLSIAEPGTRRFLAYGMFPAWSPDGGRLAFQRARERGSRLFSIWTVDLAAGEARQPTEIAHREAAACIAPRWSPDGAMIVYCLVARGTEGSVSRTSTPPAAELWVADLKTGLRIRLTDGSDACFNPVWARDGRIFFVSPRSGTENIWSLASNLSAYAAGLADSLRVTRADPARGP